MDDLLARSLQAYPAIWDRRSSAFRNKVKKENAFKTLAATLNTTTDTLEKRYKALREKYRKEKMKVNQASTSADADFEPWHLMGTLSFLDSVITTRSSQSCWIMIQPDDSNKKLQDDDSQSRTSALSDLQPVSPEPVVKQESDSFWNDRSTSDAELEENGNQETSNSVQNRTQELLQPKSIKTIINCDLNSVDSAGQFTDDECNVFGKFVTVNLQKLKENVRDDCMLAIHKVLLEYKKQ